MAYVSLRSIQDEDLTGTVHFSRSSRREPNMRRSHAGQYYDALPTHGGGGGDALEDENEKMTTELKDKIHVLKSLSIDIGTEVKYQDKLLREIDDDFEKTGGFLGNTMNRVLNLAKGGHNYYILYIFLFSLFVFFVLWLVIRFR